MLPLLAKAFTVGDAGGTSVMGFVIVLVVLAAIAIFVKLLSKIISGTTSKKDDKPKDTSVAESVAVANDTPVQNTENPVKDAISAPELPYTPGYVTLDGVAEQDAAVVMAIISDKTGIPLERLCFKSIRRLNQEPVLENVAEQDAAVIMAIVANKTGIALENLYFNSIKLVEE